MGMVFQHFNLFPHKTVLQNITLAPVTLKKKTPAEAEAQARALLSASALPTRPRSTPICSPAARSSVSPSSGGAGHEPGGHALLTPTSALDPEMVGEVLI